MRTRFVDMDDRMDDLADRMRSDPELTAEFLRRYELSWLHHENALEGVVYSGLELATALDDPPVADATFVASLQEIRNHKTAIDLVREEAKAKKLRINLTLVRRLYDTLVAGFEGKNGAEFRKDMPLHRAYFHEIAQPAKIPALLQKVLDATDRQRYYESLRLPEPILRDLTIEALDNTLSQAEKFFREAPVRSRKAAR